MNPYNQKFQDEFEKSVPKVSPDNIGEILNLYKNSSYSEYINESLEISNLKWVYPSISVVLTMELLTSQNYLINVFEINIWIKYIFILLFLIHIIIGYFFVKADSLKERTKQSIIFNSLVLFIILQFFFYYAGTVSNQSFFYYISVVMAIALFPSIYTKHTLILIMLNYAVFICVSLTRYSYTSYFSICLNSFYVAAIGVLLSLYFFTSKIISLVNSKKISKFAREVVHANDKLNDLNDELEKLSLTDSLTKINNRRAYEIHAEKIWSQGMRSETSVTVMLVDIDHFKQYNDYFGHAQGDECLFEVAQSINSRFKRKSDLVARIGGEEFIIVLASVNVEQAAKLAEQTLKSIKDLKIDHPKNPVSKYVTASIGIISLVPTKEISIDMAFIFADKALYEAKSTGRNKFCIDHKLSSDEIHDRENSLLAITKGDDLKSFVSTSSISFFSIDYDSHKFTPSKELHMLLGIEQGELETLENVIQFVYKKDQKTFNTFVEHLFSPNFKEVSIEFRLIQKNKKLIWVSCLCYLTYDELNQPSLIVGTLRNIDEDAKNKEIINDLLDGNYVYDLKSNKGVLKGDIVNDLDMSPDNAVFDFNNWYNSIYFKDKTMFDSFISKVKFGKEEVDIINLSYRVRLKDKRLTWFSTRNKVYKDVDGMPSIINGTIINMEKNFKSVQDGSGYINSISGLPDRNQFYSDLSSMLKSENLKGHIFFIDIDNFSNVNNIFGYSVGNEFLLKFSRLLDKGKAFNGRIYHFEGDVFAIICPSLTGEEADVQMKSIKDISKKSMLFSNVNYEYTLSITSIEYPKFGKSVDEIFRNNDITLQKIKTSGKNNMIRFSKELFLKNCFELEIEKELRISIDKDMENFQLYYQPLISSETNECIGAEALLRWKMRGKEMIMPITFIPILEKTGLMSKVGQWVLKESTKKCKDWLDRGRLSEKDEKKVSINEDFSMNINISPLQLVEENFEKHFLNHIDEIELSGHNITLELTEDSLIMDIKKATTILNALRNKGIKVAIDDFGTGYSSLSYIRQLPVDEVKIDRSFVKDVENDAFSREFVNSIINIAKTINKVVCVEGVETETQSELLKGYGTDFLQGYLYSKPIPSYEFEKKFL